MNILQLQIPINELNPLHATITEIDKDKFPILARHWTDLVPIGGLNTEIKTIRLELSYEQS